MDGIAFAEADLSSIKKLGEFRGRQEVLRQRSPETLELLKTTAVIESTESSNRLEGVTASHERIEALVQRPTAPANRSEQEIAGYRDALNLVHESARDMAFSRNVVLQLHSVLYKYLPDDGGRWKMTGNDIVERNADGSIRRIRFAPVAPVMTPQAMQDLETGYGAAIDMRREPLVVVPLAILDFL